MISAAANNSIFDYSGILADISRSVSHLKSGTEELIKNSLSPQNSGTAETSLPLYGYAVSYLEPQALFSVHQIASETEETGRASPRNRREEALKENGGAKTEDSGQPSEISDFRNILAAEVTAVDSRSAARAYAYLETIASPSDPETTSFGRQDALYVSGLYEYVKNINAEPTVLIDLMHRNNRSYDYMI